MFQQANSNASRFEFGLGPLDKNQDDRHARFVSADGVGRAEQSLLLRPHLVSGEVLDGHDTVEKLHTPFHLGEDGPDNRGVATNSCKIFGISLAEKVRARDEVGSGDAIYPSSVQSLKQQVPKSLGNSCATVHEQRPVVGRAIDVQQWI